MKYFDWNEIKNSRLRVEREVCFEDVIIAISEGNLLDILQNSNQTKYPSQKVFVVKVNNYVYLVPFIEDEEKYFLKTIYASRKMTKIYLFGRTK